MVLKIWFGVLLVGSTIGVLAGCDAGPGAPAVGNRPPVVDSLSFTPRVVDLNDPGSPYAVVEGEVTIPITVQASAFDPDGVIAEVRLVVESPFASRTEIASVALIPAGQAGRFEGSTELTLPVAETGRYPVVVYAVDATGRLGNEVRAAVEFRNTGSAPVLVSAHATPERLAAPYPSEIVLTAEVTDADGRANVAQVEARAGDGRVFRLRDDGSGAFGTGDEQAGDGTYAARVPLDAEEVAPLNFSLQALDRSGLRSDTLVVEVPVE